MKLLKYFFNQNMLSMSVNLKWIVKIQNLKTKFGKGLTKFKQ